MMDFHVITSRSAELVIQVIDGHLKIVPPPENSPEIPLQQSEPEHVAA